LDLGLAGLTVVVTGGASNIGRGIALAFAGESANVWIADRDEAQARRVAELSPERVRCIGCDVTDPASVEGMTRAVLEGAGRIDVLVNCAGWVMDRLFLEKPRDEWEREVDVTLWGFVNCTRAVLPSMIERAHGSIVSIGSDAGRIGEYREAVYSGAKAAVIAMSKAIAREVGRHGIRLNVVCPGLVPPQPEATGRESMWSGELAGVLASGEALAKAVRAYPLRRSGTAQDVADAVLFLASDRASYITGQTLSVDGGYVMV